MFMEKGFCDFISKPIDSVELNKIMEKWIPREKQKPAEEKSADIETEKAFDTETINIEGINTERGIAATGGTVQNYLLTLAMYHEDGEKKIEQIKECLKSNDIPLFTTHVHALKSSSASIGAQALSDLAGSLEDAGARKDMSFINNNSPQLLTDLEQLMESISEAISTTGAEEKISAEKMELLLAELKMLRIAMAGYDIGTINEIIKDLQSYVNVDDIGESISAIIRHEIVGEYEEAIAMIDTLI